MALYQKMTFMMYEYMCTKFYASIIKCLNPLFIVVSYSRNM